VLQDDVELADELVVQLVHKVVGELRVVQHCRTSFASAGSDSSHHVELLFRKGHFTSRTLISANKHDAGQ
jgi:hypothetical protein